MLLYTTITREFTTIFLLTKSKKVCQNNPVASFLATGIAFKSQNIIGNQVETVLFKLATRFVFFIYFIEKNYQYLMEILCKSYLLKEILFKGKKKCFTCSYSPFRVSWRIFSMGISAIALVGFKRGRTVMGLLGRIQITVDNILNISEICSTLLEWVQHLALDSTRMATVPSNRHNNNNSRKHNR